MPLGNTLVITSTLESLFGRGPPNSLFFHGGAIELSYTQESKLVYPVGTDFFLEEKKKHI